MEYLFTILFQNRKFLYSILRKTPGELLFEIPEGFRNHIFWNIAHVVVTQQLITYGLSNLPLQLGAEWVAKYRKGTIPGMEKASEEEISELQKLLFSTLEQTQLDYNEGRFKEYESYTTSANLTLNSVEEALAFNVYHEGLHLGAILSLQKALAIRG
jgi:hypothetical protein